MKDDGGQAFPQLSTSETWERNDGGYATSHESTGGMTLRQWYAGLAMQALINPKGEALDRIGEVPEYAFMIADAMIEESRK